MKVQIRQIDLDKKVIRLGTDEENIPAEIYRAKELQLILLADYEAQQAALSAAAEFIDEHYCLIDWANPINGKREMDKVLAKIRALNEEER